VTALVEINSWTSRIDDVYAPAMPIEDSEAALKGHAIRVSGALWKAFGEVCKAKESSRSVELRRFMAAEVAAYEREQRRIARESADS
jgi:hypothetical protein